MRKTNLLSILIALFSMVLMNSCGKKCDCKLVEFSNDHMWVSKEDNKVYSGTCSYVYGSGKVSTEMKFDNGVIVYKKQWYESGQLWTEQNFNKMGVIVSDKTNYENGKLMCDITIDNGTWCNDPAKRNAYPKGIEGDFASISHVAFDMLENSTVGSKVLYDDGKTSVEKINPIEYISASNQKRFIDIISYTKEGYIDYIHGSFGGKYFDHEIRESNILSMNPFTGKYDYCKCLFNSIEDTKDINKIIDVFKSKEVEEITNTVVISIMNFYNFPCDHIQTNQTQGDLDGPGNTSGAK